MYAVINDSKFKHVVCFVLSLSLSLTDDGDQSGETSEAKHSKRTLDNKMVKAADNAITNPFFLDLQPVSADRASAASAHIDGWVKIVTFALVVLL